MHQSPPQYDRAQLHYAAERFRLLFAPSSIGPLDIEGIIEFRLALELIPVRGLRRATGVRAWLCNSGSAICIDATTFQHHHDESRVALMHEVAHFLLHFGLLPPIPFRTPADCDSFQRSLGNTTTLRIEEQAREFTGRALLPRQLFARAFRASVNEVRAMIGPFRESDFVDFRDTILTSAIGRTAEKFGVVDDLVAGWVRRDGLASHLRWQQSGEWLVPTGKVLMPGA